jgi:hypothetical protein
VRDLTAPWRPKAGNGRQILLSFLRRPGLGMRSRLTLLYGGLFLIAGGVLITILYAIFSSNFPGAPFAEGLFTPASGHLPRAVPSLSSADMHALGQKLNQHRVPLEY